MRIISQDCRCDIQYEKAVLHIFYNKHKSEYEIGAYSLDTINKGEGYIRMARYSTEEKAIKAMEMCLENYAAYEYNKNAISALIPGCMELPDEEIIRFKDKIIKKMCFLFPKDKEVE